MKNLYKIEILCEANSRIGFGHLNRSLNIYFYLNKLNIKTYISELNGNASKYLPNLNKINYNPKILLLDIKKNIDKIIKKEKKNGRIIITLDHFGKNIPDYNIIVYPHKKYFSKIKSFVGLKYVIIKNNLLKIKKEKFVKKIRNISVVLGGGDKKSNSYKIAKYLSDKGFKVNLIYGPLSRKKSKSKNFRIYYDPKNYNTIINKSDLLITNGGGCMLEGLYLNKPIIAIPHSKEEINFVNHIYNKKLLIGKNLNFIKKLTKNYIINKKPKTRIIDGKGLKRISKIIKKILNSNE